MRARQPLDMEKIAPLSESKARAVEAKTIMILIVEDRHESIFRIKEGIFTNIGKHFDEQNRNGIHIAKTFAHAEGMVNNFTYDLVFLDHLLPENESVDGRRELAAKGYTLVEKIKKGNPRAFVVGTSSFGDMIRSYPRPDISFDKDAFSHDDMDWILAAVKRIME